MKDEPAQPGFRAAKPTKAEEQGWTPDKPIVGIALMRPEGEGDVDVGVAGAFNLDFPGPDDATLGNIRLIVACAKALGVEPPPGDFAFIAGQIFYQEGKLNEARLFGEVGGERWSSDPPPRLRYNAEEEALQLHPDDHGRTHLSALTAFGKPTAEDPEGKRLVVAFCWDLRGNLPPEVPPPEGQPLVGTGTKPFPLSFGPTRADRRALDFAQNLHQLRLPRRWSSVTRWSDLVANEVERLQEDGRDDLLRRRVGRDGKEVVRLTPDAERQLRIRAGLGSAGFREVDEKTGREFLVRLVQVGTGHLDVGLSWWGMAGPLVDEWVAEARMDAEKARQEAIQLVLFEDLAREQQTRLDAMLARVRCWDYGRKVLEAVLGQIGRQAQNPVVVPAESLRLLLSLDSDPDWKNKVEGALEGLRGLESRLRSFDLGAQIYGYGTALASWTYVGRGPGSHGDGDYYLELGQQFLGCLHVFESGQRKLRGGVEAMTLDWSREVPAEERAALGWTPRSRAEGTEPERFHAFDAGRVFYNAAEGLTPAQDQLVSFLEAQLTMRRDTAAKDPTTRKPWTKKARADAEDANKPRLYDRTFCPLLGDGAYQAALGHFAKNPESGRTLGGTPRRAGKSGGAHHGGLLHEMGYLLEPGGATEQRWRVVQAALEDLRTVVVDYLGGVVAARGQDGAWLTAEEAQSLPWETLVYRTRWFLFLPETWREDRRRRWEERTGYRATEDEAEARAVREARWAGEEEEDLPSPVGAPVGPGGLPLYQRLHIAMKERGLSQGAVAQLFGVSQQAVSLWFKGTHPDPGTGAVTGKPIPAELRPLVEQWITTGEPPTEDELAARKTRRTGRRGGRS